jgi:MFS family permease
MDDKIHQINTGNNLGRDKKAAQKNSGYITRLLITVTAVALLINYVETMVIPGVPAIQQELSTTATVASWITSAFLIVGCAVAPLFGKLGDTYGKKKMFLVALVFYIAGLGIAGVSQSIEVLILSRAVQGIGYAIMPLTLAVIADSFPKEKIATAQGIISATFAIGAAAGLVIGSYVVQSLGWHAAFHTTFILSIVLFGVIAKVMKKDAPVAKSKVDYIGAFSLMAGLSLILVYITEGPTLGWFSLEELALLIPGAALTVFFFVYENKIANPLIQLKLLKIRNVLVANLVGIVASFAMLLLFYGVIYYAQLPVPFGLGIDIVETGIILAPAMIAMILIGPLVGKMVTHAGPRPVLVMGSGILTVGLLLFIVNRASNVSLIIDTAVSFAGIVSIIVPIVNMIAISLPKDCIAVGLGINTTLRNLGSAIGPVIATAVMASFTVPLTRVINGQPVVVGQLPSDTAFNVLFAAAIVLSIIVAVLGLTAKNYTFKKKEPEITCDTT